MKKIIAILSVAFFAAVSYANPVIYVVDISQVHESYYKTKEVQEKFSASKAVAESEIKGMIEKLQVIEKEVQAITEKLNRAETGEEAKKAIFETEYQPAAQKYQNGRQEIENYRRQTEEKFIENNKQIVAVHRQEILAVIEKIAKEKKADLVLEKRLCHFTKPTFDITEDVVAALNANAPKS